MVPMLTCGLVRSNFAFATGVLLKDFLGSYARAGCPDASGCLDLWVPRRSPQARWCMQFCCAQSPVAFAVILELDSGLLRFAQSPVAFAMISLATLAGTSLYESNCML